MKQKNERITSKQTHFANLVAEEGMSNTQAYIIAYNPSKNAKNKNQYTRWLVEFSNVEVQSRIRDVQCQIEQDKHMRAIRRKSMF